MTKSKKPAPVEPSEFPASFVRRQKAAKSQGKARETYAKKKTATLADTARAEVGKYGFANKRAARAISYYSKIAAYRTDDSAFVFRKFKSDNERKAVKQLANRGAFRSSQITPSGYFVATGGEKVTIRAKAVKRGGNPALSISYKNGRKQTIVGIYEDELPTGTAERKAFLKSLFKKNRKKGDKTARWADLIYGRRSDFRPGESTPNIDKYGRPQSETIDEEPEDIEEEEEESETPQKKPRKYGRGILIETEPAPSPKKPRNSSAKRPR